MTEKASKTPHIITGESIRIVGQAKAERMAEILVETEAPHGETQADALTRLATSTAGAQAAIGALQRGNINGLLAAQLISPDAAQRVLCASDKLMHIVITEIMENLDYGRDKPAAPDAT